MLKNYLRIAFRNLARDKATTLINLSGLALGITSCLILFLLIDYHSGFDQYHSKKDRIYRIVTESDGNTERNYTAGVPAVLPDAFRNDFPEAEAVTFLSYRSGSLVTIPKQQGEPAKYEEKKGVTYAEPDFFRIFDRNILIGDGVKGLADPQTAVISKRLALKYFGKEDVMGEAVKFDNLEYKITAVMEDFPSNTDFPFDLMLSMSTIKKANEENGWNSINSDEQCYFILNEKIKISDVESRMGAFHKKYHDEENRSNQAFVIQPLREIHFDDRFGNFNYNTISRQMLMSLTVIALFLIITACINFINLTTAESVKRSREVGVRKALGSSRKQLILQFLGETSMITLIAVIASLVLTVGTLRFLNPFLELDLSLNLTTNVGLWIFLLTVAAIVAFLSGFYPSWVVSGFRVTQALKNQVSMRNSSGLNLRRALVVLQFFISQFFIIGTIVLISQMNYFRNKSLGFRKDAIVSVPIPEREKPGGVDGTSKMRVLREEVAALSGVEMASLSSTPPSSGSTSNTNFSMEGSEEDYRTQVKLIDGNYLSLYGLELVAGKNILDLDTARGFLVNERLASIAGFKNPEDIIGKNIKIWGRVLPVAGVVRNFHTVSLRSPIEPTILFNRIRSYETLSIKLTTLQAQDAISQIQKKWEATYPQFIFSYKFLDDEIEEFYESENKMSVLLSIFTFMAIFIGCLGLLGLTTFMANQKTKEIGVRKVMGASVGSIVMLFSKEFIFLIGFGFLLAGPVAWFVMNEWLNEFAYKITIGPSVFILGIGVTMLIALGTVGYRSFKAAVVNPADSLRSE